MSDIREQVQEVVDLAVRHVEDNGWDDDGYYTEYHYDRNEPFGEDGNQVDCVEFGDEVLFDQENDVYYVLVNFTYGHGSRYNDGDWITDNESCWILVNLSEGTTEQVEHEVVNEKNIDLIDVASSLETAEV